MMQAAIDESSMPDDFLCPISLRLMSDPVILHTGHTYDRKSIQRWLDTGHTTCPITMKKLHDPSLTPNHMLRRLIADWLDRRRCKEEKHDQEALNTLAIALHQQPSLLENVGTLRGIRSTLNERILQYIQAQSLASALLIVLMKPKVEEEVCTEIVSILVQLTSNGREIKGLKKGVYVCKLLDMLNNSKLDTRKNAAKLLASLDASWLWNRFNPTMESGVKRLLSDMETAHEALILLREMVVNTSTNASESSYAREETRIMHPRRRGSAGVSYESEDLWICMVEKGFLLMIAECLLQLNAECCEIALEIMDKICTMSSCHGVGPASVAKMPSIAFKLTAVLMKHTEKCTLYAVLILLALLKQKMDKERLAVAEYDSDLMCSEMRKCICIKGDKKVIEMQSDFVVPGLPKQLLLVLQSNRTPAVKKRCAELLKLLDSHARLSCTPQVNVINFNTIYAH